MRHGYSREILVAMPSVGPTTPLRVLIAGGGVAGVECLLGLHELAGDRVELTLLTDDRDLHYRPLAVGEPFGGEQARHYPLADIADATRARLVYGRLDRVDADEHRVTLLDGGHLSYDALVVALTCPTGARWPSTSRPRDCFRACGPAPAAAPPPTSSSPCPADPTGRCPATSSRCCSRATRSPPASR
jgi:hypothetical protein